MRTYRAYTDEDIRANAAKVKSLAGLLTSLGLRPTGGNYICMKKNLQRLNVTCEHWTGQGWNKGEQLKDWSKYTKVESLKPHLFNLRGRQCESCGLANWLGRLIPLEMHHINGNRTDNQLTNLQLLCPTCHSLTPNYRNRKLSARHENAGAERVKLNETSCHGNIEPSPEKGRCRD